MLVANRNNINKYAEQILGNEYSIGKKRKLLSVCTEKELRDYGDGCSHLSFSVVKWLKEIDIILGTFGVKYLDGNMSEVYYCDVGDIYNMTIFWYEGKLYIGSVVEVMFKFERQ